MAPDKRRPRHPPRRSRPPRRPPEGRTPKPRSQEPRTQEGESRLSEHAAAGRRLAKVDEIEARVEKLVAGGEGLARFEGIPIFVSRAAPGDLVRLRLVERKPRFGRAEIVDVLEPGEGRREPPCPYYERCGGCDLQHLEDAVQLRLKAEALRENLLRLGGVEMPADVTVIAGRPWGYRLRAQLHVDWREDGGAEVGYYARRSHDLVPVTSCPILVPELENELPGLAGRLTGGTHNRLDLAAGDDGQWTAAPAVDGLPRGEVSTRIGDFVYRYDADCFFQSHRQLLPKLVEQALGPDRDGPASEDDGGEVAYDLFAGVGLFSLPLCRRFQRVVAVEGERVTARFARRNARDNGLENLTVEVQAVESWVEKLPADAARVIVDPPRVGLSPRVRSLLLARRPRRLTYVSCDSATLARDLKDLAAGFRLDSLALLDMFPQTGHLEVVAQLSARQESPPDPR